MSEFVFEKKSVKWKDFISNEFIPYFFPYYIFFFFCHIFDNYHARFKCMLSLKSMGYLEPSWSYCIMPESTQRTWLQTGVWGAVCLVHIPQLSLGLMLRHLLYLADFVSNAFSVCGNLIKVILKNPKQQKYWRTLHLAKFTQTTASHKIFSLFCPYQ